MTLLIAQIPKLKSTTNGKGNGNRNIKRVEEPTHVYSLPQSYVPTFRLANLVRQQLKPRICQSRIKISEYDLESDNNIPITQWYTIFSESASRCWKFESAIWSKKWMRQPVSNPNPQNYSFFPNRKGPIRQYHGRIFLQQQLIHFFLPNRQFYTPAQLVGGFILKVLSRWAVGHIGVFPSPARYVSPLLVTPRVQHSQAARWSPSNFAILYNYCACDKA